MIFTARWRALALIATFLLLWPTAAAVAGNQQARVWGRVTDDAGGPVGGLKVTAGDTGSNFKVEAETDEDGNYELILTDATRDHTYLLEKEGFETFETEYKVPAGSNSELNFTVIPIVKGGPEIFNEGNTAAREGNLELATAKYQEAIALDPALAAAHGALSIVLYQQERLEEAAVAAESALALGFESPDVHTVRYNAYKALGRDEEAAAALAAASPEQMAAETFKNGLAHFDANRMAEAREALEKVVGADPDHAKAHYYLGLCGVNTGDNALAREHFQRFLELTPEDPEAETARQMLDYLG